MSATTLPKISIVTCSYQQGQFLEQTLKSVIDQGYGNLEYIVMDGGSKDQSVEVIRRYESHLAYWVSEKDAGQSDALIKGFAKSTGDIQGWLCSDDLLLPGSLDAVAAYFSANPDVNFVYGDSLWIDEKSRLLRPKREIAWNQFIFLFDGNYLPQPSCFWRRSLYDSVNGLNVSLHLTMDADLWLRFARIKRPHKIDRFLSCMRFYPEQKMKKLQDLADKEGLLLRKRESPVLSSMPAGPLKAIAKAMRISLKLLIGGYRKRIPSNVTYPLA